MATHIKAEIAKNWTNGIPTSTGNPELDKTIPRGGIMKGECVMTNEVLTNDATKTGMQLAGNVLDELLGLALDTPGADDKIVQTVEKRFEGLLDGQVYLAFETQSEWSDKEDFYSLVVWQDDANRIKNLHAKLAALRTLGFGTLEGHAS